MKYLLEKIEAQITENGDGMAEFHTRDIEKLANYARKANRSYAGMINYLGTNNMGIHHHRIRENEEHAEHNWINPEKSFYAEWKIESKGLPTLLQSTSSGLTLKATPKVRVVAATLMQWLGTNLGWAFLERVLKREGYKIVKIDSTV